MPRKPKTTPPVTPAKPKAAPAPKAPRALAAAKRLHAAGSGLPWLREAKKQAEEMYAEARQMRSYVAAEKCLKSAAMMAVEMETLEKAELNAKGSMSEEGFVAWFTEQCVKLPTPYLELAVNEYLKRHTGVRLQAADA